MDLRGKSVAILVDQQYQEMEVWYPYYRLIEEGAEVHLVGPDAGVTYPSKLGYPATSTLSADQAASRDFNAVIVPGGWSPDFMRRDERMISLIQSMAGKDMVFAAICHGGWMLCCTSILKGRKVTSFVAIKYDMINAGATWVDEPCVVDGNIITSRKPDDLPLFVSEIIKAISKQVI
ncbi:MAG: type 1 glutamine amidotransferase [Deltaproteobacteria bacterium]|nr:type 1 glutamine amidotransferase [Deltaproteobacteria bacterium]